MLCLDCRNEYQPEPGQLTCPACDSAHIEILAGDEFQLESIVINEAEDSSLELERAG
jgi:Zn finger protein HypA/HybF involved in hydrogenase expression